MIAALAVAWRHADGHAADNSPLLRRRGCTGRNARSGGGSGPRPQAARQANRSRSTPPDKGAAAAGSDGVVER